ncbi:MAG: hypothetical protein LKJ69_09825 [Lactobacillus sp.]|nr:hypothetical protein [Lactobacillus sp.]MCI2033659.1 hypothetical protein [Lactobacillus sp.]
MKKTALLAIIPLLFTLAACGQGKKATSSSSSQKTAVLSKQYTTTQLEKRYGTIVDAVVKPLDMASYERPTAEIKASVTKQLGVIDEVRLQLDGNNSQPDETQALITLADDGKTMLNDMLGQDQKKYNASAQTFMSQTTTVSKKYFAGRMPQSVLTYSARMRNQVSSSASSSSSASQQ